MTVKFFTTISLPQAKNFVFSDLMNKINNCLTKDKALGTNFQPFQTAFTTAYATLDAVMKNSRKSLLSNEITALDEQQIQIWRVIRASAREQQKLANTSTANAANFVMSIINNHGNVPRLKLVERTGALTNLVQDLTGKYADLVAQLGLTSFANQLAATHAEFLAKYEERLHEWSEYTDGEVLAARTATDEALENLLILVAGGILTQGMAGYKHFVDYVNEAIKVAKIAMGVSTTKPEGGDAGEPGSSEDSEDSENSEGSEGSEDTGTPGGGNDTPGGDTGSGDTPGGSGSGTGPTFPGGDLPDDPDI